MNAAWRQRRKADNLDRSLKWTPSLIKKIDNFGICVHVKTIRLNGFSVILPSADCRLRKKWLKKLTRSILRFEAVRAKACAQQRSLAKPSASSLVCSTGSGKKSVWNRKNTIFRTCYGFCDVFFIRTGLFFLQKAKGKTPLKGGL